MHASDERAEYKADASEHHSTLPNEVRDQGAAAGAGATPHAPTNLQVPKLQRSRAAPRTYRTQVVQGPSELERRQRALHHDPNST